VTDHMKNRYNAWLNAVEAGSPVSLEAYRMWVTYDDNLPWRLDSGAVVNLLDEAMEEIDRLSPRPDPYSYASDRGTL